MSNENPHAPREIERVAMALEWLRRNDADFDQRLRTNLSSSDDTTDVEEKAEKKT